MTKRFFSYDADAELFEFHEQEETAKARARSALNDATELAEETGDWDRSVNSICWGEIRQRAVNVTPGEETAEYRLEDVRE